MMHLYTWCDIHGKDGLFVSFCVLRCLILCVRCVLVRVCVCVYVLSICAEYV